MDLNGISAADWMTCWTRVSIDQVKKVSDELVSRLDCLQTVAFDANAIMTNLVVIFGTIIVATTVKNEQGQSWQLESMNFIFVYSVGALAVINLVRTCLLRSLSKLMNKPTLLTTFAV